MLIGQGPVVVAHRGASGIAPENTLSSIRRALEVGATMVEIDVHTTADGEIVAMHDAEVSRTTDGQGPISEISLEEIRRLDAGSWFGPDFRGERVPTLDEALDLVRGIADLCIEVKAANPRQVIQKVLDHEYLERVILFDFDHPRLYEARKLQPNLRTLALGICGQNLPLIHAGLCSAIGCPFSKIDGELVERAHRLDLAVFVYTVNRPDDMKKLVELGVDAIITDFPQLALKILDRGMTPGITR